jgi:hypothetical protein
VTYQGLVFTNPGGPGDPGLKFIELNGSSLQAVVGAGFDMGSARSGGVSAKR